MLPGIAHFSPCAGFEIRDSRHTREMVRSVIFLRGFWSMIVTKQAIDAAVGPAEQIE